ncbi:hypothetical protein Tco_0137647, partial [Tanacetum coccineum]
GIEGLVECKALASNLIRIQVKDIVKEVKDYLKTYSSARMDISWYVEGIRCSSKESQRSTNVENLQQGNDVEILDEQKDIHDVKGSKTQASVSACSGKFKRSAAPETGGSILCLLEELVKVGMGYNMEGCMNNMTEIIKSQGAAGVFR